MNRLAARLPWLPWSIATLSPLLMLGLAACSVAPPYETPALEVPSAWQSSWHPANPRDHVDKDAWWTAFKDAELDRLELRALDANQSLRIAAARVQQASALVQASRSGLFPSVDAIARATRQRTSAHRPGNSYDAQLSSTVQNDFVPGFVVSYELDLFGRVRSDVEASRAIEAQTQADLSNARLLLTADVAATYFSLRAADAEIEVVEQNIALQMRAVELLGIRHDDGASSGFEVAQQQAQLDATKTQLDLLRRARAQVEHALAVLIGTPASSFGLAPAPRTAALVTLPAVPPGLPSEVIERRPDVAGAERAVMAANAQIGVARAGFFPSLRLTGNSGWESREIESLFNTPSLVWSLGASLAQTVFDAGRTGARVDAAKANHAAASAAYRQTVLQAFQEVEDGLSALEALASAAADAQAAVVGSQRVLDIADERYRGGLSSYLEVITAQQSLLANRRLAVQILGQQQVTTSFLVKALGGGWNDAPIAAAEAAPK